MLRICKVCQKEKDTPYKDICRSCYQRKWEKQIPVKSCLQCQSTFTTPGKRCWNCLDIERKEKCRKIPCSNCNRGGLLILNMTEKLCTKCDRQKKEAIDPMKKETRRRQVRESARRQRGTDLNAPIRRSKGFWNDGNGYIVMYNATHANRDVNNCIKEHFFVMSNHLGRPIKRGETVHHINGQRDDNRIENLEIWHRSHPPGQRLHEKIEWAKNFLEEYGYLVIMGEK